MVPHAGRNKIHPLRKSKGETMANPSIDWAAIDADPRFQELHARKSRFLWGLMMFAVIFYFLLPIGAGYFTDLYKTRIWGVINFGLLFALSQFIVAWAIAWHYSRRASQFDAMADELARDVQLIGRKSAK
jgi:uncharacterized membrane protein (DUF485 family)